MDHEKMFYKYNCVDSITFLYNPCICIPISFSSQKSQNKKDWKTYRSIIYTMERQETREIQGFLKKS